MFDKLFIISLIIGVAVAADIGANSKLGRKLLSRAVSEDGRQLDDQGYSFLGEYAIKFQGCHHVQQWNDDADEEEDVRIMTKRLARFRLCPIDQCNNEKSVGCTSKYGDYVVDLDTFLQSYLEALEEDEDELCDQVYQDCYITCASAEEGEEDDCNYSCHEAYDATFCLGQDNDNDFEARQYAECQQFDFPDDNRRLEDAYEEVEYYLGAYCADQGGEVRLGVFSDDTCTTFVSNGYSMFYSAMGFNLPYSSNSLISSRCFDCSHYDDNGDYETKEVCEDVYEMSGKCETRMSIDYPNESSCNYIEGVKIIRQDGVIRTSTTRKSKAAAVAIGLFMTLSVLLGGYVFYLRTKLARAQINLAAASQSLT